MRVTEPDLVRIWQPQTPVKVDGVGLGIIAARQSVEKRCLGMLVDDLVRRVEACRRRLRDIGNAFSKQPAPRLRGRVDEIDAIKGNGPADNLASVAREAHRRQTERRFAGAGLADQPEHLAPLQVEADIVDDPDPRFLGKAVDFKVADTDKRVPGGHLDYSFRPDARCSIQSTTKFTATVSSAIAPAAMRGSDAVSGPTTGNGA